jgi:SAM-dependent methyltransferase
MIAIARREVSDPRIALHVADLAQPLDFLNDRAFDLVFSSLVVHYLEDLNTLFAGFARLLKPGGCLVFSIHHPHEGHGLHPGSYFESRLVTETWHMNGEPFSISFYRRPLRAITEALAQAGFVIERMTEALPTEDYRLADPEGYAKCLENPSFLCVRARRE